ncbi:HNH endonuclease [Geodermatophilus sp. SYSU D01036]
MWGGRCWVCGIADATAQDHVKPISRGGSHCLSNLRPICHSCNASKRASWPLTGDWRRANFRHPAPKPGSDRERRRDCEPWQAYTCPQCGITKSVPAFDARNRKYCSHACAANAQRRTPVKLICECCKVTFQVLPSQARGRRFCSVRCASLSRGAQGIKGAALGQLTLWDE